MEKSEILRKRYEGIKKDLQGIGFVLKGTITQRIIVRPSLRNPGKENRSGPYYQWTWKKGRKTVTVNLSESQAREYGKAIQNHRKLEKILREMVNLSLQILELSTVSVKKKKKRASLT
jgi:hypothetical protein